MPLVKVGPLEALPPGSVAEVEAGGATYAICNFEGELHCLQGACPHAGGPLGQGTLNGTLLTCPWHGWEFDCRSGVNDFDEDVQLETFPVVVQDQNIFIETL
jgi:nitrite reductase (NADH) small subunit